MKKIFAFFVFCIFLPSLSFAAKFPVCPELERLDLAIRNADIYAGYKEARIDSLRNALMLPANSDPTVQYALQKKLFREYDAFNAPLALHYAAESLNTAELLGSKLLVNEAKLNIAAAMIIQGMTDETADILASCDRNMLPDSMLVKYYINNKNLYSTLARVAGNTSYEKRYSDLGHLYIDSMALTNSYLDSMASVSGLSSLRSEHLYARGEKLTKNQEYVAAQELMLPYMNELIANNMPYGILAHTLAKNSLKWGNTDDYVKYLALAAISDIEYSVRVNSALYYLSVYCHQNGDFKRAYSYTIHSLKDAVNTQATVRVMRIGRVLPIIHDSYSQMEQRSKQFYTTSFLATVILIIFLIVAVYLLYRQMRKTAAEKQKVLQVNQEKDKYIRHFLDMTSLYINKLHSFRRAVRRKIQAGQTADLLNMNNNSVVSESELKDFFQHFDTAFLSIYPDFVEQLNQLLRPEERFPSQDRDRLNPELRIFALMHFNITDNQRIASFLGYSINTIYTYRHKLKNKAVSPDTFEEDVARIGEDNVNRQTHRLIHRANTR